MPKKYPISVFMEKAKDVGLDYEAKQVLDMVRDCGLIPIPFTKTVRIAPPTDKTFALLNFSLHNHFLRLEVVYSATDSGTRWDKFAGIDFATMKEILGPTSSLIEYKWGEVSYTVFRFDMNNANKAQFLSALQDLLNRSSFV